MPARLVAVALLGLAYVLGSHWLMTSAPPSPWNAVGLLSPMLGAAAFGAWQAGQPIRAAAAAVAIAVLVALAAFHIETPAPLLYLGQHVATHLALALWFGSTLRLDGQPLISMLAEKVHGHLTPGMAAYTRNVTRAWVGYFVAMAALSVLLFASASFDTWARFANLVTPLAVAVMFVGERLLRYRLHPEFERASMADSVRAYLHVTSAPPVRPSELP